MIRTRTTLSFLSLLLALFGSQQVFAQITLGSLADELGDRDVLATFPTGSSSYTLQQASSHDTRNGTPFGSQLGGAWGFENVDFGNYVRQETNQGRQELVLFEDSGPGAITRWWQTGISGGLLSNNNIRIYIDGSASPALTQSATSLVGGNNNGFGSSLNFGTPNLGGNFYGPITYASGVKVTWDGPATHGGFASIGDYVANGGTEHNTDNAVWYNINYRKYEPGTVVESYNGNTTNTYAGQLGAVNSRLSSTTVHGHIGNTDSVTGQALVNGGTLSRNYDAPAGATNGQAIRQIALKFNGGTSAEQRDALAGTFIELTFDGRITGRIPVGQFFGNGWSENASNVYNEGGDYFRTVAGDGTMSSRWVMPFQDDAQVRLINQSGHPVNVDLEIKTGDYVWSDDSMHFHANYRSEDDILTRDVGNGNIPANERYSAEGDADFRFLDLRGRGVFVGDTMSIRNRNIGSSASGDFWWGEGDEKIYIDYLDSNGDGSSSTPDQVGTGTEDYYGYSFGSASLFGSPFVTQPIATGQRDASGNGLTVNGRVRGLDAIPFEQSLKFDMEVWKWRQGALDVGAATFWYGEPGAVALNQVADLATDFRAAQNGESADGIEDTTGDGSWTYFASDNANPSAIGADLQNLTWGTVGDAGNQGFGGGENGSNNLAAISDEFLFVDGGDNIGMQGSPGYHELAIHPGGNGFEGNADREYVVAQWTAGDSVDGMINIGGSVRNFITTGDSIDFYIYVNGVLEFSVDATSSTLDETPFDFDSTIAPGQTVQFVLGNGGSGNPFGDEALLRATILADFLAPLPGLLGDFDGDGTIGASDWQFLRDNFGTPLGDLNDDEINNTKDYLIFRDIYINNFGAQAFAALVSVPEPSAVALSSLLITGVLRHCRK